MATSLFGNLGGGHTSLGIYQLVFSRQEFDGYFKFGFVRNPWDRIFSAFHFLKKGGFNEYDRRWAAANLVGFTRFRDFVRTWVSRKNVLKYVHFVPQYRFLCLPYESEPGVDFVGYYESLEQDFQVVCQKLFPSGGKELPHKNRTNSESKIDYKESYDDETREIVADVYQRDIRMFGYSFDNSSLPALRESRRAA